MLIQTLPLHDLYEVREFEGKRNTFPVCFSFACKFDDTKEQYKSPTKELGRIQKTRGDFCPTCGDALFWISKRAKA